MRSPPLATIYYAEHAAMSFATPRDISSAAAGSRLPHEFIGFSTARFRTAPQQPTDAHGHGSAIQAMTSYTVELLSPSRKEPVYLVEVAAAMPPAHASAATLSMTCAFRRRRLPRYRHHDDAPAASPTAGPGRDSRLIAIN